MSKKPTYTADFDPKRQIAIVWSIEDVQEVRPDLSDGKCFQVLLAVKRHHDARTGINWDVLDCVADALFPEPADGAG
jgi:hypothetical protein